MRNGDLHMLEEPKPKRNKKRKQSKYKKEKKNDAEKRNLIYQINNFEKQMEENMNRIGAS